VGNSRNLLLSRRHTYDNTSEIPTLELTTKTHFPAQPVSCFST